MRAGTPVDEGQAGGAGFPQRLVARRRSEVLRGDVDGDGTLDEVWIATASWPSGDEVYPTATADLLVARVNGRLLPSDARADSACSGERVSALRLADATGDGRLDIVAHVTGWTCEVGTTSDTLWVLTPHVVRLTTLADVTAPRWAGVGPFEVGEVRWSPGVVDRVVVTDAGIGTPGEAIHRSQTRYRWLGDKLVLQEFLDGPLQARLDGRAVAVASISMDGATVRSKDGVGSVKLADLSFPEPFVADELSQRREDGVVDPP